MSVRRLNLLFLNFQQSIIPITTKNNSPYLNINLKINIHLNADRPNHVVSFPYNLLCIKYELIYENANHLTFNKFFKYTIIQVLD